MEYWHGRVRRPLGMECDGQERARGGEESPSHKYWQILDEQPFVNKPSATCIKCGSPFFGGLFSFG
eukprot:1695972-Amphidinium_carterae.1